MKIFLYLKFKGPDSENIPKKLNLEISVLNNIEYQINGQYKATIEINNSTFYNFSEHEFENNIFLQIQEKLDYFGINAIIEDCEIISYSLPKAIYEKGGLIRKYAEGGKIDSQLENDIAILESIKTGNPNIDNNDPEIQDLLKTIYDDPSDEEIKELLHKAEKALKSKIDIKPSDISPKQKIEQKIKGFEILLKLAKTDEAKVKINQKIKGFNILLKLKK